MGHLWGNVKPELSSYPSCCRCLRSRWPAGTPSAWACRSLRTGPGGRNPSMNSHMLDQVQGRRSRGIRNDLTLSHPHLSPLVFFFYHVALRESFSLFSSVNCPSCMKLWGIKMKREVNSKWLSPHEQVEIWLFHWLFWAILFGFLGFLRCSFMSKLKSENQELIFCFH